MKELYMQLIEIILKNPLNPSEMLNDLYKKITKRPKINDLSFRQTFEILVNSDEKELDQINRFKTTILSREDILKVE